MSDYLKVEQAIQDRVAENYETLRYKLPYAQRYHHWRLEQMLRLVDPANWEGTILDNGCGPGTLHQFLPTRRQQMIGLDLSMGMLRKAQSVSYQLVQSDCSHLPFPDETFSLIFARALLHHLPDPIPCIAEMHRVLKPGGQVILSDTNSSILSRLPRKIAYKRDNFSEFHNNLTLETHLKQLQTHFSVEAVDFFGYFAYPFGFPDMMGPLRKLPFPLWFVNALIGFDKWISRMPSLRHQSWGVNVAVRKPS